MMEANDKRPRAASTPSGPTRLLPAARIDAKDYEKFRIAAAQKGLSISEALRQYMASGGNKTLERGPSKKSCEECIFGPTCSVWGAYKKIAEDLPGIHLSESQPEIARAVARKCDQFRGEIIKGPDPPS